MLNLPKDRAVVALAIQYTLEGKEQLSEVMRDHPERYKRELQAEIQRQIERQTTAKAKTMLPGIKTRG